MRCVLNSTKAIIFDFDFNFKYINYLWRVEMVQYKSGHQSTSLLIHSKGGGEHRVRWNLIAKL